jgi:organic hydroperoxide reductase OsmC/OhrA
MSIEHKYNLKITWTGNSGTGTSGYTEYERSHTIEAEGKPLLLASSDSPFRGDKSKYNPEDFLVASISTCHMLWFLHLCADAGIVVTDYIDEPQGILKMGNVGEISKFSIVTLHPKVNITDPSRIDEANQLHQEAHKKCFISNSVNFPVEITSSAE